MKKKRLKIKWYNIIALSIILVCLIGLFITMKDIIKWKSDSYDIEQQVEQIQEIVEVEEVDDEETEDIEEIEKACDKLEDIIMKQRELQ